MRTILIFLLLSPLAWAADVVVCDPTNPTVANSVTSYQRGVDSTDVPTTNGYLVWNAPNNAMTPERTAFVNLLRGQIDSLQGIPVRHWKCTDQDSNGMLDGVTEMTQAQKDLVEAPRLANQARSLVIETERANNDACNAEPSDLDARIDAAYASANTAEQIKTVTVAIIKKLARCVWARTTVN